MSLIPYIHSALGTQTINADDFEGKNYVGDLVEVFRRSRCSRRVKALIRFAICKGPCRSSLRSTVIGRRFHVLSLAVHHNRPERVNIRTFSCRRLLGGDDGDGDGRPESCMRCCSTSQMPLQIHEVDQPARSNPKKQKHGHNKGKFLGRCYDNTGREGD